jgi:2-dehydropantoate 2-reductase
MMSDQSNRSFRVAVLGAGAMGSLFGGSLFEGGADVTLIDLNVAHVESIRKNGLNLKTDAGERRIHVPVLFPSEVNAVYDLIIVFTKAMHTKQALIAIRSAIGPNTALLSLQNGLDNKLVLTEFVDPRNVLIGITTYPADIKGPGSVESHGRGVARLAAAGEPASPTLDLLPDLFARSGLNAVIDPHAEAAIWEKVAFNAALNGLCAITGSAVGQIGAHTETRALAFQIVSEVCTTAIACGFAVERRHVEEMLADAFAHHIHHKPSMLQDVIAGRPTEIEAICGAVVRRADGRGVATPVTRTILGLVRHIDWRAATVRRSPDQPRGDRTEG